ncbi:class I SAM-dependent methyltransferase [Embleya sp. NPDC059237]|uniref:class I SAM-dependent methyltransferase n=1 Tax=Embleya sp. NPDC059237 TaxID=3346784 RepID=UPI00369BFEB2
MTEHRLFPEGTIPEYTRPDWYADRDRAPHLEQPAHRDRLWLAARSVVASAIELRLDTAVDLGAGDGGLLSLLRDYTQPHATWGYDLQPSNVTAARDERGVDVRQADVLTDDIEWADIAVATEMLEHLVDPHAFVRRIAERSRVLVASSPHDETPDHHYEYHCWTWDHDGYRALLEQAGYGIRAHHTVGPFQIIVGYRNGGPT